MNEREYKNTVEAWDFKCPYCQSENVDGKKFTAVFARYRCDDCHQDFLVWNNGSITDPHKTILNLK